MSSLVEFLHRVSGAILAAILWPFHRLSPDWQLIIASVGIGLIFLLLYKQVSNQARLRAVKRSIHAAVLEVALYRHDLRVCLAAQGRMLKSGALYFLLAVPPVLILLVPMLFLLAQLNLRFGYAPIAPGAPVIVRAGITDPRALFRVEAVAETGLTLSAPLRRRDVNEILWRAETNGSGEARLTLKSSGGSATIPITTTPAPRIIPQRAGDGWARLLYPDPDGLSLPPPFGGVAITYPERNASLLGWQTHWIIVFAIVSILSGLVFARVLRVEI